MLASSALPPGWLPAPPEIQGAAGPAGPWHPEGDIGNILQLDHDIQKELYEISYSHEQQYVRIGCED